MSCSPDSVIDWSHTNDIAMSVDDLAESLGIEAYDPLFMRSGTPFGIPAAVPVTFAQRFDLEADQPIVAERYLTSSLQSDTAWAPDDEQLADLINAGDVYFVADEDGCLCKTIYQLIEENGSYTLKGIEELGCCQSLEIPDVGQKLDNSQFIIPSGYVRTWFFNPPIPSGWKSGPACTKVAGGAAYKFETGSNNWRRMIAASREMSGVLVWQIRSDYFNQIWNNLETILSGSCGSDGASFYKAGGNGEYPINRYCPVTIEDLIFSSSLLTDDYTTQEGGITTGDEGGVQLPWEVATNGASECDGNLKVYCNTLLHLEQCIDLAQNLEAKGEDGKCPCPQCQAEIEWSFSHGCNCAHFGYEADVDGFSGEFDVSGSGLIIDPNRVSLEGVQFPEDKECTITLTFTCKSANDVASTDPEADPDSTKCSEQFSSTNGCHDGTDITAYFPDGTQSNIGTVSTLTPQPITAEELCCSDGTTTEFA